jgi:hypothetical protein
MATSEHLRLHVTLCISLFSLDSRLNEEQQALKQDAGAVTQQHVI